MQVRILFRFVFFGWLAQVVAPAYPVFFSFFVLPFFFLKCWKLRVYTFFIHLAFWKIREKPFRVVFFSSYIALSLRTLANIIFRLSFVFTISNQQTTTNITRKDRFDTRKKEEEEEENKHFVGLFIAHISKWWRWPTTQRISWQWLTKQLQRTTQRMTMIIRKRPPAWVSVLTRSPPRCLFTYLPHDRVTVHDIHIYI